MQDNKFHWRNFKDVASHIERNDFFEKENNTALVEAWKRIFISRLYYYAFHTSVEVAEDISKHIKDPTLRFEYNIYNAHGQIRNFYKTTSSKYPLPKSIKYDFYKVSNELLELHTMRKNADYDLVVTESDLQYFCLQSKEYSLSISLLLERITQYFHDKFEK